MSFSGTPLGQGRRLDHHTFLAKPSSKPSSPQRLIPAYGAPTRSPTKPLSPEDDENDPALARFARIKQREQVLSSRPGGPKVITSPPKPEKWSVKDTTVNIATAFTQAASDMHSISNPNNAWASGSSRPNPIVPRSSSVEYENQAQAATSSRRLAAPPSRTAVPRTTLARKPISKSGSSLHVPDSEGEEDRNTRAKSPFGDILDSAKRFLGPATFYLQQRQSDPGDPSLEDPQPSTNGDDPSYDYAAEEREFQSQQARRANNTTHTHRRNRMSTDNKAYKPSASDVEEEDEFSDDGKGKRRKKKKKKDAVGLVNTLPSLTYDKRKKKKGKGGKGTLAGADESDGEGSESDDQTTDKQSTHLDPSIARSSIPPSTRHSLPRHSVPPDILHNDLPDTSLEDQQGLDSIPEVEEDLLMPEPSHNTHRRRSTSRPPSSRIGGPLGSLVHLIMQAMRWLLVHGISTITYFLGLIFGTIFSLFTTRPHRMYSEARRLGLFASLLKYIVLGLTMSMAWYFLRDPLWQHMPHWSTGHVYTAPDAPVANIAELVSRLQRIENALSGISLDTEKGKARADNEAKSHMELLGRLGALESKAVAESKKAAEAEVQYRNVAREGLNVVRQEVEALQAQVQRQQQQQQRHQEKSDVVGSDEEARAKLKALEERVGSMESGVKEALELGKKVGSSAGTGSAWWNKLASGSASKAGLTIKSSDGQDVSGLIGHLVESAVSMYSKDILARPDYAQHTNGALIIPSLTSPTYELRPSTLRSHILGTLSGAPFPMGRSPLNALHHDVHSGYCWPFSGTEGQLALSLAAPIYITDVTIDHVAKEVALDIRSAPREMELWGLVEGKDNIAKVNEWKAEKAKRKEEAKERGEEVEEEEYPKTLPKTQQYIRVANFSYDINAPNNVQTFPVLQEIRDLGVDFAVVALRVKNNWGRNDLTCLYRLRVHGEKLEEKPLPYSEESV